MRRLYGYNDVLVQADDLWAFAWSEPMRDLAAKLKMSDVGLKKLLISYGVVTPPRGYWNRVQAGARLPKRPLAPARKPGQTGLVSLDSRFAGLMPVATPLSSRGPFASEFVPEGIAELYARELKALGVVRVPKTLDSADAGLSNLLKQEARRREKAAASGWAWDNPKFDSALAQRQLRIFNAILLGLRRRGHQGTVHERDGELGAGATIGDTYVGIELVAVGSRARARFDKPGATADLPAKTPLKVRIVVSLDAAIPMGWQDGQHGRLEASIPKLWQR